MENNEEVIWEDSSSQILNFGIYSFSLILFIIAIGGGIIISETFFYLIPLILIICFTYYLSIRSLKYKLTNQRLIMEVGIINKITDEIELYRIKDHRLEQPFFLRIFGLGNIILITSDQLNHNIVIKAITNPLKLKESIRLLVEARRTARGVREIDTN